jgi:phosphotransferase system enzyme I (PtsI)
VDELSVTPRAVLPLRNVIRNTDMSDKADKILAALDSDETHI